jgi:hypothetical protein
MTIVLWWWWQWHGRYFLLPPSSSTLGLGNLSGSGLVGSSRLLVVAIVLGDAAIGSRCVTIMAAMVITNTVRII